MAYKRNYKRYKRNKKGRDWGKLVKKGMGYANTAIAAYKLASKVAGLVNVEYKYYSLAVNSYTLSNAGSSVIYQLCNPVKGTDYNQRTGDSILLKHLRLRLYLNSGSDASLVRVMLFKARNQTDTITSGASGYTTTNMLDYVNSDYIITSPRERSTVSSGASSRFWTIYDRVFRVDDLDVNDKRIIKIDRNFYNTHIKWAQGSDTYIQTGGIYLLIVSDGSGVNQPTCQIDSRFTFIDN